MRKSLNWGIISTGRIAGVFAEGVLASQTGKLVAVGSRKQETADAFGETWNIPHRYASYDAVLTDNDVEAVYIATPHPYHAQWAIRAAEAGKHILCEKPIALNYEETIAIVEAARRNDVFLLEAYMYRGHPQIARLKELISTGAIGEIQVIQATFTFRAGADPESRLLKQELGGGGILDVGGYCMSMARLIAGVATQKGFAEPVAVKAVGHIGTTGVDEYSIASLVFPGNILAQLWTGVRANGENVVRIFGTEGSIILPDPWTPQIGKPVHIIVRRNGQAEERFTIENDKHLYGIEADTVAEYIEERQSPTMNWQDTLGNMRALDMWRRSIELTYDSEKPDAPEQKTPFHRRPLAVRPHSYMKYGKIPGLEKQVSRLVMGVMSLENWPYTALMLDDFFEQGGNCFDTACIYGGGRSEKLLGQWIRNRNVREQVVIFDKGAHTPHCDPDSLTRQLFESLDRLQTDYIDIYMLHRDNPAIPVGEFITVLNEHQRAGRLRVFGGSNWSLERIEEANDWATKHGMQGFSAVSNNFSLARMVDPIWDGCISASDFESRTWLKKNQMPLMPWSSQARGFFIPGRAHPEKRTDPELVRCWYSDDNFQRLERTNILAQKRGVLPINIALAYVLYQPFPTFPVIGPLQPSETYTSLPALTVELTPEELRWLNLED